MQEIDTIREELELLLIDPYPESIFPKVKKSEFKELERFWVEETSRPIDALSADYGRIFRKNLVPIVKKALKDLNILEAKLTAQSVWQPIDTAPKDGTKIFLFFEGLDYAPIASWQILEDLGDLHICSWAFQDESFGEDGDGWLYEGHKMPIFWADLPKEN